MGATKKLNGQSSNNITKTEDFKVVLALVFGTLILQLLTFHGVSRLSEIYESWIGRQGEVTTTLLSVGSSRWPWIDCISFHPHDLPSCFILELQCAGLDFLEMESYHNYISPIIIGKS